MRPRRRVLGLLAGAVLVAGVLAGPPLAGPAGAAVVATPRTIAAGAGQSLVVKTDATLWTFGRNRFGALGTATNSGTEDPNPTPTQVMTGVAQVAAGQGHSLVVKTDGTLWSFGRNRYGQLGTATNSGTENPNPTPTQVMTGVAQVAAGWEHSLVVKTDGMNRPGFCVGSLKGSDDATDVALHTGVQGAVRQVGVRRDRPGGVPQGCV